MKKIIKFHVGVLFLIQILADAALCTEVGQDLPRQLKALMVQSQKAKQIQGKFKQKKTIQELNIELETSGHFLIQKANDKDRTLFWSVEKPEKSELCIGQDTIIIQSPKKQVISLKELDGNTYDQILYLLNLLSFNFDFLEKNFSLNKEKENWSFRPRDNKKSFLFERIDMQIDSQGKIKVVELFERKDKIHIQFEDVRHSNQLKKQNCQ